MLDEILGAIAGGAEGVSNTWFGLQKLKQDELDRASREKIAGSNNDTKIFLKQMHVAGMIDDEKIRQSGQFSTQELRNMGIATVANINAGSREAVAGTNAAASGYRADRGYDASIYGTDVRSSTAKRGQDIGAATSRRGQDMTRGNVERGISAGLWGKRADIDQRNYAVGQMNRRGFNKGQTDESIFGPTEGDANDPSYMEMFPDQPPALPQFDPSAPIPNMGAAPQTPATASPGTPLPPMAPMKSAAPQGSAGGAPTLQNMQEAMATLNGQIKSAAPGPGKAHLKEALRLLYEKYKAAGGQ